MADEAKKGEPQAEPERSPTFDEVVRKMLNTPPKPKKSKSESAADDKKRRRRG